MPEGAVESLCKRLKEAESKSEFQRVQCIWLRAALGLSASQIAVAIGWHPSSVKKLQSEYLRKGESVLGVRQTGGRRHENMSLEEEKAFLAPFFDRAKEGGMVVATEIKIAYEQLVGRTVPKSTIYRMLDRHNWRKIVPRPRHPKKDSSEEEEFKKTSRKRFRNTPST